jgi:hypothetical protein
VIAAAAAAESQTKLQQHTGSWAFKKEKKRERETPPISRFSCPFLEHALLLLLLSQLGKKVETLSLSLLFVSFFVRCDI